MSNELNIEILESSFNLLSEQAEELVSRFYERLFEKYPAVQPLFSGADMSEQKKKLFSSLVLVVNNLKKPEVLTGALRNLGRKHQDYGALEEHYPAVEENLLAVMQEFAGDAWTEEMNNAWSQAIRQVSEIMLQAYEANQETEAMNELTAEEVSELKQELDNLKKEHAEQSEKITAIDKVQAVIEFNLDGTIITANENFLNMVGYSLEEIQGKHHRMFVDSEYGNSAEYKDFWNELNNGVFQSGQYRRINKKGEDVWINASYNPIHDMDGKPFKVVKYATDGTELRAQQIASARLQVAVDGAQANLMLCDNDLNITYANLAVVEMLRARQNELKQIWPSLDVENLVGQNIDQFHKNPAHQRALLSDPSRLPAKAEIKVGDLEFSVNATMVKDASGNYMGNMVEWQDITEQKQAEDQIQQLIRDASAGKLDKRIDVEQYNGFMRNLGEGINSLLEAMVNPLKDSMRVIQALADGNLTEKMDGDNQGEFAEMQKSVNTCTGNLRKMVLEIRASAESISFSAKEISTGNIDLSQRTENQASSLEETASSVEQMTGTVKQNADNARQANQLASGARDQAEKGGDVVGNAISAMSEINKSSKQISDIIGVIDEIAFQTNLLALNAAVEAARAGEQGRGFAVVASEVRNLAQRSADAAKEIKSLINDSVSKVEEGSRLVDESGATLEEIVTSVKKVSDIVAEISAASEEQAQGIEEINKAVSKMDEMTQQNAALVEEAAAASDSMDAQANGLYGMMNNFNVGENGNNVTLMQSTNRSARPARQSVQVASVRPIKKVGTSGSEDFNDWDEF